LNELPKRVKVSSCCLSSCGDRKQAANYARKLFPSLCRGILI